MDLQDLRHAYDCATQQVNVLEVYLHELNQRCERLSMDANTDFDYLAFKLRIMAEVKKLYEHYRDMKQEQFQQQCASELTDILHHTPDQHDLHDNSHYNNSHHDNSLHGDDAPQTNTPIHDDLDIHRVPSLLTPIEDLSFFPETRLQDSIHTSMDIESDFVMEQFRNM